MVSKTLNCLGSHFFPLLLRISELYQLAVHHEINKMVRLRKCSQQVLQILRRYTNFEKICHIGIKIPNDRAMLPRCNSMGSSAPVLRGLHFCSISSIVYHCVQNKRL